MYWCVCVCVHCALTPTHSLPHTHTRTPCRGGAGEGPVHAVPYGPGRHIGALLLRGRLLLHILSRRSLATLELLRARPHLLHLPARRRCRRRRRSVARPVVMSMCVARIATEPSGRCGVETRVVVLATPGALGLAGLARLANVFLRERGGEGKNLYKTWRLNFGEILPASIQYDSAE